MFAEIFFLIVDGAALFLPMMLPKSDDLLFWPILPLGWNYSMLFRPKVGLTICGKLRFDFKRLSIRGAAVLFLVDRI